MRKIPIILNSLIVIITSLYSLDSKEELFLFDGDNRFYLLMPVSEVYRILGDPMKTITVINPIPNHNFEMITLEYPGLTFIYHKFGDDPGIELIGFSDKKIKLGNQNVIGCSKGEIAEKYDEPKFIEIADTCSYYRYEFWIDMIEHINLQFRFNLMGVCDGVILTHSSISV